MKTIRRIVSILLAVSILAGNLSIVAFAEPVLALPAALEVIAEEAFYGAKSLDKVILPESVKEIGVRAFANSSVKTINLPSSLTYIADDAFDGARLKHVTAVEGSYAYNWAVTHHYITPKVSISIQSVSVNATTVETGMPITWTVVTKDGVGSVSYNYAVYKNGLFQDEFSVSETDEAVFVFTPETEGYWNVLITVSDSLGLVASEIGEGVFAVDTASYGDIELTLTTNVNAYLVGDKIQIVAKKKNTCGTAQYAFIVRDTLGNTLATQTSSDSSFGFIVSEAGNVTIYGTVTDELGRSASVQQTISVYSEEQMIPAAPQSLRLNGDMLPENAEQSTLYTQQDYIISWDKVNEADSYRIQVTKTEDKSSSVLVDADEITDTTYVLSADLFSSIEQETTVQIRISARNRVASEPAIGYFKIKTKAQQQRILINGEDSAVWNDVYYAATEKTFQIESDLEWTAESNQSWIDCYCDKNTLTIKLSENAYAKTLSGTVTVSNGVQSSVISVTHGCLHNAPQLLTPSFSAVSTSPAEQPYGDLYLMFDENNADYVTAQLYKKLEGNEYIFIAEKSSYLSDMIFNIPSSVQPGDVCKLKLQGYSEEGYNTKDESAQKVTSEYYFVFSNDNHFIYVNGQERASLTIFDSQGILVSASTVWTYESDVDWLTVSSINGNVPNTKGCWISAKTNNSSTAREGHITFISGTKNAYVTVIQKSSIPYISCPKGLSEDPNSPTELASNTFYGVLHNVERVYIDDVSEGTTPFWQQGGFKEAEIIDTALDATTVYQIMLVNSYCTSTFYFKTGDESIYYINLTDENTTEENMISWNVSTESQSKQILLKTNGNWTVEKDAEWIAVSPSNGSLSSSGKNITITVQANTTGIERSAVVVFKAGATAIAVVHIKQAANDYITVCDEETFVPYHEGDTVEHISGAKNDFCLKVRAGAAWSVSSDSSWLAFDSKGTTSKTFKLNDTTKSLYIYCAENAVGNASRTATVTFTSGSKTLSLRISQDSSLEAPSVLTAISSTDINNPSVVLYQDIHFSWLPVTGAVKYAVKVNTAEGIQTHYIDENGSSEYAFTIPYSWLSVDGKPYFFRINPIDRQGNEYSSPRHCYTVVYDDKAFVNGSATPVWENATDYQASNSFTVSSAASWVAVPQQSWIHVSPASGESGETITVTLDDNPGAKRNGSVDITVNGNITTLNIFQCAKLAEYPSILSPAYSNDLANPTVVTSALSSLTVTWDIEPQATYYRIYLCSFKTNSVWKVEADSGAIRNATSGSYTFDSLQLESDKLYKIGLTRRDNVYGQPTTVIYFTYNNSGVSTVRLSDNDATNADFDGNEDYQYFTIESSEIGRAHV